MRARAGKKNRGQSGLPRQINIRVEPGLYRALEVLARQEQRSVSQVARQLVGDGLRERADGSRVADDTPAAEIAAIAAASRAFDWLVSEPDLYDDTSGEPL